MAVAQFPAETAADGSFRRQDYVFKGRITADGSSGYRAEPGRYHLYVSWACPWAQRSIIVRGLKKLEDVVTMSVVDPTRDERGWAFRDGPGHSHDPVNGFHFLREAYEATDPEYRGRWTVPVLWDRATSRIVSNNFDDITIDLNNEFSEWADSSVDLYPPHRRGAIDAVNAVVYENVNDGVYKAGFATTQAAYEKAFDALFATLDELEARLSGQRFLVGNQITEADVRLFTTLARFDAVYYSHFKCNRHRLVDFRNLWGYARDLYQTPGFGETCNFDHIKRHYYGTHPHINPTRIVPKGPDIDWLAPHDRARFAAR